MLKQIRILIKDIETKRWFQIVCTTEKNDGEKTSNLINFSNEKEALNYVNDIMKNG